MIQRIIIVSLLLTSSLAFSQVKDISVTISPAVEYTFWDNQSGLDDGLLYGAKIGFGFGEYIELRATYMKGYDLVTNFEDFGLTSYSNGLLPERDVELSRWGGEFKANFGTKTKLNPYFTLGSGVQTIQLENFDEHEQIFATIGLGAKFNIGKRVVFTLEAKNTVYNFNAGSRLLTQDDQNDLGVTNGDFETERLSNWSAMASLQFYLSGRRPGDLSELDKAYLKTFSSGFKGLRFTIEPSLAYVDFDEGSRFRDAWFVGGYVGVDFNDYIGLRAFYFKATNDDELSSDFDQLQMYGGEFRARLNVPRGVVPYLSIGGGYLDVTDGYVGMDGLLGANDSYFASGGLGLNVPLSKEVAAFGGVKALLTSDTDEENIQNPDQIQNHIMYNFGIKFNIGSSSKSAKQVYQKNIDDNVNEALAMQREDNQRKIAALKDDYKSQIVQLEEELKKANEASDVAKAVEIIAEKNEVKKALKEVEDVERANQNNSGAEKQNLEASIAEHNKRITKLEKDLEKVKQEKDAERSIQKNDSVENEKIKTIRTDYGKRIEELEEELQKANQDRDIDNAVRIIEEKNTVKKDLEEFESGNYQSNTGKTLKNYEGVTPTEGMIQMTPEELELLIARITEKKVQTATLNNAAEDLYETPNLNNAENEVLKQRVDELEQLLLQSNKSNLNQKSTRDYSTEKQYDSDALNRNKQNELLSLEILSKLNELNSKIERNSSKIDMMDTNIGISAQTINEDPLQNDITIDDPSLSETITMQDTLQEESFFSKFTYKHASAMFGLMLMEDPFPVASLRLHYTIEDSKFEFMPELFLGATDPLSFGLSLNGIRPIELEENSKIKPYVGAGLGYMKIYDAGKLNLNLILGTYINVLDGKLYIDYTVRNFFNYNQLSVGYNLNF